MSKYCKESYGVPADIGRIVKYKDNLGVIYNNGGTYVSVNLDKDKPGVTVNIHPTDENLAYLGMGKIRKMTRSQQRYQDYLRLECSESFGWYIGAASH